MLGVLKLRIDWDVGGNVGQMWEQVKRAMVDSVRGVWLNEGGGKVQRMYGGMMW